MAIRANTPFTPIKRPNQPDKGQVAAPGATTAFSKPIGAASFAQRGRPGLGSTSFGGGGGAGPPDVYGGGGLRFQPGQIGGGGAAGGWMGGGGGGGMGGYGGGGGGFGGAGGGMAMGPTAPLSNVAQPIPELQQAQREYQTGLEGLRQFAQEEDPYLKEQIEDLRKRKGEDETRRATERAAGDTRDFMAGLLEQKEEEGARMGRGPGFGASSVAEAGQRALARQASDIQLGQQKRLDELTLGGLPSMAAPGQRRMQAQALLADYIKANPAATQAQIALQAQKLGLEQWALPQQIGIQYLQAQNQMLNPMFSLISGLL